MIDTLFMTSIKSKCHVILCDVTSHVNLLHRAVYLAISLSDQDPDPRNLIILSSGLSINIEKNGVTEESFHDDRRPFGLGLRA